MNRQHCSIVRCASRALLSFIALGMLATAAWAADSDLDGVEDQSDNAPLRFNPSQYDGDYDGVGDISDNAPLLSNFGQHDADGDGLGDASDPEPANPNPVSITIDTGGPYTISLGSNLVLDFSGSSTDVRTSGAGSVSIGPLDQLTWLFDYNDDGAFVDQGPELYDVSGPVFTVTWPTLVSMGIQSPGQYDMAARAYYAALSETASFQVTVVPEPASFALAALAISCCTFRAIRRRGRRSRGTNMASAV